MIVTVRTKHPVLSLYECTLYEFTFCLTDDGSWCTSGVHVTHIIFLYLSVCAFREYESLSLAVD